MRRTAFITGAGQGIGLAIAVRLDQAGYQLILADINPENAAKAAAQLSNARAVFLDVARLDSIGTALAEGAAAFGGIDVLVNNAGLLDDPDYEHLSESDWDRIQDVNIKGLFFCIQKALPYLRKARAPRIVNIASIAGRMGSYASGMSYVSSKGAVLSLTRGLSRRLAPEGITVNAVCPGTIQSDMIMKWTPEKRRELLDRIPIGRLGRPEDIGGAVCYLASEEAGFVTGVSLDVNGGMFAG